MNPHSEGGQGQDGSDRPEHSMSNNVYQEEQEDGYGRPPNWMRMNIGHPQSSDVRLNPNAVPFIPRLPPPSLMSQQFDRLLDQLERETYECLICCSTIFANHWIWSCSTCFHIFHYHRDHQRSCITQWAAKSVDQEGGWRCPSCQNISYQIPNEYRCFCGKELHPRTRRGDEISHSCGEICGKERGFGCPHKCTEPCHPGPCPPCPRTVQQKCRCGRETKSVRCGSGEEITCSTVCGKPLNCGAHKCETVCHGGACGVCDRTVKHSCHCLAESKEVACTVMNLKTTSYTCGQRCQGHYSCNVHKCEKRCHAGECGACPLSPERLVRCPCGKAKLKELLDEPRSTCEDPVPTCDQSCDKVLECGPAGNRHRCKADCHVGPCPPCTGKTAMKCRCQASNRSVPCVEAAAYDDEHPLLCERRCKKVKSCQTHRCQDRCCVDADHVCLQMCNRKLNCGMHTCERLCHVGQCPPCLQASFDEQRCLCGITVREPPIPCGAPLPPCAEPCARQHACDHPVTHACHAEPECPPCTHLTAKWCYGRHELRGNIPCYLRDVSCGRICQKDLPCGMHQCQRMCHQGSCVQIGDEKCKQKCAVTRDKCGHPCGQPCHGLGQPCPKILCASAVLVTCPCGRLSSRMCCSDIDKHWLKVEAAKALQAQQGGSVRILERQESHNKFKCLSCDSECGRLQRNKKLASALGLPIEDELPTTSPAMTSYTEFLQNAARCSPQLVVEAENALIQLVQETEKQHHANSRNHVFKPMSSDARRIIHEYAAYFRVETVSYDPEPHRNVVATAKRGQSCIPPLLLSASICKPAGMRNVWCPPPPSVGVIGQKPASFGATGSSSAATDTSAAGLSVLPTNASVFRR